MTLQLAFAGNGTACTAQLARSGANGAGWELRVRVPVLPLGEWIEQMRRDAPHKMGTLQLSSTQLLVEDDP